MSSVIDGACMAIRIWMPARRIRSRVSTVREFFRSCGLNRSVTDVPRAAAVNSSRAMAGRDSADVKDTVATMTTDTCAIEISSIALSSSSRTFVLRIGERSEVDRARSMSCASSKARCPSRCSSSPEPSTGVREGE
jgi:hypothetical protein